MHMQNCCSSSIWVHICAARGMRSEGNILGGRRSVSDAAHSRAEEALLEA